MTAYAELQITSNFSFLCGGSHPEELVLRAAELGLPALALTDRNTLAGVVRAHVAAKEVGIRFVVGARLDLMPGENKTDSSFLTEATTAAADPPRSTAIPIASVVALPGIPGLDPVLGSERGRGPSPQLAPRTRQSQSQAGDLAPGQGMDPRVEPGGDGKKAATPRALTALPSSSGPDTSHAGSIDDLSTTRPSGSAPHAMVGGHAPPPGKPRCSDSHHSPRPDPNVPHTGKRQVNATTTVSIAEGRNAADFIAEGHVVPKAAPAPTARNTTDFAAPYPGSPQGPSLNPGSPLGTTGPSSSSCPGSTRASMSHPGDLVLDESMGPRVKPGGDRNEVEVPRAPTQVPRAPTQVPRAPTQVSRTAKQVSRTATQVPSTPEGDGKWTAAWRAPHQPGATICGTGATTRRAEAGYEEAGYSLLCFPTDRAAYGRLSQLISLGQRRALKGDCRLWLDDVLAHAEGQIFIVLPPERLDREFETFLKRLRTALTGPCYLAAQHLYRGDDAARIAALAEFAAACSTPLVATGDVLYHTAARRPLQDVLTCIREHCTIDEAGYRLAANAERHLKPGAEMARLFQRYPEALTRTLEIAEACRFSLDELRYEYPIDPAPAGLSVQAYLEQLTWAGARERYPDGIPDRVRSLLEHEFALIAELG